MLSVVPVRYGQDRAGGLMKEETFISYVSGASLPNTVGHTVRIWHISGRSQIVYYKRSRTPKTAYTEPSSVLRKTLQLQPSPAYE